MNPAPLLPALLFVAAPAPAMDPWGIPDLGERDKQQHAAAGLVVGVLADAATKTLSPRSTWWRRTVISVACAAIAGAAKEVVDARTHDADPKDALATVAGGTVGVLAVELVWRF